MYTNDVIKHRIIDSISKCDESERERQTDRQTDRETNI